MTNQENSQFEEENNNKVNPSNTEELKNQFCPYLGLKFDPKSWVGYPSPINYCHRVKPLAIPKFDHQRELCLTKNYIDCPIVYGGPGQRMPKAIQSQSNQGSMLKKIVRIEVLIGMLLVAIILGAIFWKQIFAEITQIGQSASNNPPTRSQESVIFTPSPTIQPSSTYTITLTATKGKISSPTQTPIPPSKTPSSPTATVPPPIFALETPIGNDIQFIIHAVIPGESLELYAKDYNTTVEAIRAINYKLPSFLPLDWTVIIPLNTNDVTGVPAFEPYEVGQAVTVEVLADQLTVDLTNLRFYNRITKGYTLSPGEWIILPREPRTP